MSKWKRRAKKWKRRAKAKSAGQPFDRLRAYQPLHVLIDGRMVDVHSFEVDGNIVSIQTTKGHQDER